MQCLLDTILVCVTREKVKKMQNKRQKPITGTGSAVSAGRFITNWDQITLEGTREGRERFACDLKQQYVV